MGITLAESKNRLGAILWALLAGISVPLLVWAAIIVALQQMFIEWRVIRKGLRDGNLACRLDIDCPPGYQCIGGKCVPVSSQ